MKIEKRLNLNKKFKYWVSSEISIWLFFSIPYVMNNVIIFKHISQDSCCYTSVYFFLYAITYTYKLDNTNKVCSWKEDKNKINQFFVSVFLALFLFKQFYKTNT